MNIFITGATGGLGQKLIPKLSSSNYKLSLLSLDKENPFQQENVKIVAGNLLNPNDYKNDLKNIDVIIHLAAVTHTNNEKLYYQINTEGTKLLVDLAQQFGIKRFIFISTRAIGEKGGAYSNSKSLAEEIVKQSKLDWTIVRPAEVYGVAENEAITKLIRNIEKMPIIPIIGNGQYKISPVAVEDVINALIKIIELNTSSYKTYTLAGQEELSYLNFINLILKQKKLKKLKVFLPVFILKILANLFALLRIKKPFIVKDQIPRLLLEKSADISLARRDLNYNPQAIKMVLK